MDFLVDEGELRRAGKEGVIGDVERVIDVIDRTRDRAEDDDGVEEEHTAGAGRGERGWSSPDASTNERVGVASDRDLDANSNPASDPDDGASRLASFAAAGSSEASNSANKPFCALCSSLGTEAAATGAGTGEAARTPFFLIIRQRSSSISMSSSSVSAM